MRTIGKGFLALFFIFIVPLVIGVMLGAWLLARLRGFSSTEELFYNKSYRTLT